MRTHPPVRATYSLGDPAGSLSKGTGSAGGYAVQPCLCKQLWTADDPLQVRLLRRN
jgi:hypothetical protein